MKEPASLEHHETEQPNHSSSSHPSSTSQKKPTTLWIAVGIAIITLAGVLIWYLQTLAKSPVELKTYKVGVMSVDHAVPNSSTAVKRGAELAEKLNKTDAVDVQLVIKSTDCDPKETAKAMREFATEGVVAVVGEFCSGGTLGAAPAANELKIPLLSPASTSPKITSEGGEYVYRTIPSDTLEMSFLANAIYNKYHFRKLAIMYAKDPFGEGARDALKENFEKLGGKVVAMESFVEKQTSVKAELTRLKAANPDSFFIVGTYLNNTILTTKKEMGFTVPVFGPDYFTDPQVSQGSGNANDGLVLAAVNDGTQDFKEKYQAAFGAAPDTFAAQSYDALSAIMEALKQGATNGETIKAKLDILEFDGASGHIKFDTNGDVAGNYRLLIIKNSKAVPIE